jgi:hypothetical protein
MKAKEIVWIDSGYDCDHCGGEVLRLKVKRPSRPNEAYYRCQVCGCEWTLQGDVVHIGGGEFCRDAQSRRLSPASADPVDWLTRLNRIPRWLQVGIGLALLLVLLRFGGFMLFRLLLPLALIGIVIYLIIRLGREQQWW